MAKKSTVKNLEVIYKAIDEHNSRCDFEPRCIAMNPFEIDRLGWDEIRGIPLVGDPDLQTGRFRIVCDRDDLLEKEEETEVVDAYATSGVGYPD